MNKKIKICTLGILLLSLFSCGSNTTYSSKAVIEITNAKNEGKILTPSQINISETLSSIESKKLYNLQVMPSMGNVNMLVIPILLPDYQTIDIDNDGNDDKDKVIKDLNKAFFGKSSETAFESVASYYEKSSYGKLHLSGEVLDWFDLTSTDLGFETAASIDTEETFSVVEAAVNYAKNTLKIDLSKYDNDKDGYIDGVWCIYSCPNYSEGGPHTDNTNYWAYTTRGNQDVQGNVDDPIYSLFGWASYDFMYESYGTNKIDSHTYIHETGHFLGLNDYYSDSSSYCPLGRVDMMDGNISDHNLYSKMLLGWVKPYVVTGNGEITISSMENENQLIVIPDDDYVIDDDNSFDPFSEYIMIELYTNDNLNYKDSKEQVKGRPLGMNSVGVRIYHVDNRKFFVDISDTYNLSIKEYEGENLSSSSRLVLPITNARGSNVYNTYFGLDTSVNLFDEIRLIEKNNVDTFSNGGSQKDRSLFVAGDTFSLAEYGSTFFYNKDKFDNQKTFSYSINIKEIS